MVFFSFYGRESPTASILAQLFTWKGKFNMTKTVGLYDLYEVMEELKGVLNEKYGNDIVDIIDTYLDKIENLVTDDE